MANQTDRQTDRQTDSHTHTHTQDHQYTGRQAQKFVLGTLQRSVWFDKRYIHAYVSLSLMIARSRTGIERANSTRFKCLFSTTKMRMFLVSSIVSTYSNYKSTRGSNRIKLSAHTPCETHNEKLFAVSHSLSETFTAILSAKRSIFHIQLAYFIVLDLEHCTLMIFGCTKPRKMISFPLLVSLFQYRICLQKVYSFAQPTISSLGSLAH